MNLLITIKVKAPISDTIRDRVVIIFFLIY